MAQPARSRRAAWRADKTRPAPARRFRVGDFERAGREKQTLADFVCERMSPPYSSCTVVGHLGGWVVDCLNRAHRGDHVGQDTLRECKHGSMNRWIGRA